MPHRPSLRPGRVRDAVLVRLEYARRAGRRATPAVVPILGMHRSGTSALAGSLQEAGLYLGNVLRQHPDNAKGTRENLEIVGLHDAILAHSGGTWREPPGRIDWTSEHRAERDRIVRSYRGARVWGFKDPRTVLLLDFWREPLANDLAPVGCFRHPAAVVASLLRRDGGVPEEWFALWSRYNEALLAEHANAWFPIVEVADDERRFRADVGFVAERLGLHRRDRPGFFDARLQGAPSTGPVPRAAEELYVRLRQAARSRPKSSSTRATSGA